MRLRSLPVAIACLLAAGHLLGGAEPDAKRVKQVQDDVHELRENAFRVMSDAEFKQFSRLIHPKLVDEARYKHTSETRKRLSDLFKVEKIDFPAPPRFFSGTEHEFVYVPYS